MKTSKPKNINNVINYLWSVTKFHPSTVNRRRIRFLL